MTTINSPIFEIPQDVLLRCVADYLGKRDQYKLFSLCSIWKPLLYQCRLLNINDHEKVDRPSYQETGNYPNATPRCWHWFKNSPIHRQQLLTYCNINNYKTSSALHRPFRLDIKYEEIVKFAHLILQLVQCFESIAVSYRSEAFNNHLSDAILRVPTVDSLNRYLLSGWEEVGYLHTLPSLGRIAQQVHLRQLPAGNSESVSFTSLRGVHRLFVRSTRSMFVEMSLDCTARLHSVVLEDCGEIEDITSLQGLPEVKLVHCTGIRNVFPLVAVDTVILEGLRIPDISMLGGVRKLTLVKCKMTTNYPIPAVGKGQEWEFHYMDISDVSDLATLEKLTLVGCHRINDISMLEFVQYLHIDSCVALASNEQYPTASGERQEWTFTEMAMPHVTAEKFCGLQSLQLRKCFGVITTGFKDINELKLIECLLQKDVFTDMDVSTLSIISCRTQNTKGFATYNFEFGNDVYIASLLVQVIETCPLVLHFSAAMMASLQALHLRNISNYFVAELNQKDLLHTALLILDVESTACRCYLPSAVKVMHTEAFTNLSLRTAVELWCLDSSKASQLFGDISNWNVSQVTNMSNLFLFRTSFNGDVSNWNVRKVVNMSGIFSGASSFNQPLHGWDVSSVTDMSYMFSGASSFNQSIGSWNVGNVVNMSYMLWGAIAFNQPLNRWDVSNAIDTSYLFYGATSFDQSLDSWDVSNVVNMSCMFHGATQFNQALNSWDVDKVVDMTDMFYEASSFNQNLESWLLRNPRKQ